MTRVFLDSVYVRRGSGRDLEQGEITCGQQALEVAIERDQVFGERFRRSGNLRIDDWVAVQAQ